MTSKHSILRKQNTPEPAEVDGAPGAQSGSKRLEARISFLGGDKEIATHLVKVYIQYPWIVRC